ncbi:MAG: peptidoglycan-binding domain-containing protein [Ilumatobacteraceae bacterium]
MAGAVGLVMAVGVGWVLARQVQSPEQAASNAAPPEPSWVTATVERRVLTQTVITRGDVVPQVSVTVGVPSSVDGDPVVTGIGVAVGDEVTEGQRVIEVSGRPVLVLTGEVPVYRSLRPGMTGADVAQLQAALGRLGCASSDPDGFYGEATKMCVAAFYTNAGYEPVPSSATEAIDIAAAEQAVADAEAVVDAAEATFQAAQGGAQGSQLLAAELELGAAQRAYNDAVVAAGTAVAQAESDLAFAQGELDRLRTDPTATASDIAAAEADVGRKRSAVVQATRSGDSAVAAAADSVRLAEARLVEARDPDVTAEYIALGQAMQARDTAVAARDALRAFTGATVAQGEVVFVPSLPARVRSAVTALGPVGTASADPSTGAASTGQLVELSAGELIVTMTLRPDEQPLVRRGMTIEMLDEQTNTSYPATLSTIDENPTTGPDGQTGYRAEIAPDRPLPAELAGANLRVTISAASTDAPTLVVPVTAISSSADGTTSVSVLPDGSDAPVLVPVTVGLTADGFVAVEPVDPATLATGDRVVVGR